MAALGGGGRFFMGEVPLYSRIRTWRNAQALVVGSNGLIQVFRFHTRSPESGDSCYKSRHLKDVFHHLCGTVEEIAFN